jgi:multidrug efflux pump subunit AcrA (membrane-fusion protein)
VNHDSQAQKLLLGILIPLSLIGIGIGAFFAMGQKKARPAAAEGLDTASKLQKLPIVAIGKVVSTETLKSLDLNISGSVVPFRQINLAVEIAGRVRMKSENCQIGKFVKRGEVLFELDPTDFELDVERLEAMQQSELAQQGELDQDIANAKKSLQLADEELAIMDKDLKRLSSLAKGLASEAELDQARRQRVISANQRQNIQNQLQTFETRRARLKTNERLAAAQLQQAKVNLERTKIVAPIDGVIVTESVQTDSFVQRGATLCVIEDTQHVEVSCSLRSDQLLLILQQSQASAASNYELPHTPVTVVYQVSGREEIKYEWRGELSRYEGIGLDPQSRTSPVRVRVDNPQEVYQNGARVYDKSGGGLPALVRGMFVECKIHTTPPKNTVLVPKLALKPGNQIWRFVQDDSLVANEAAESLPVEARPDEAKQTKNLAVRVKPEEWTAGTVKVLSNIRVINLIDHGPSNEEFWVIEGKDQLSVNDHVIVSPLANMMGDGNDKVRYQSFNTAGSGSDATSESTKE